jgi:hypothetical protein
MHSFHNTVRFEHEMFIVAWSIHNGAIVARARGDFPSFATRKLKQDLVEEPVFAQSTDVH